MLECVINVSVGTDSNLLDRIAAACGPSLLDVHSDAHHNRSVFTLAGPEVEAAARALTRTTIDAVDLRDHVGVHPRIGVVDVVPFVALDGSTAADATRARNDFAHWLASDLGVPAFYYGTERTLPDIRRGAFTTVFPDVGPPRAHQRAGAVAVGVRPLLVAYNVWVDGSLAQAKRAAKALRSDRFRLLGLQVGDRVQVSCNLIDPAHLGPAQAFDAIDAQVPALGAELVGLLPTAVLQLQPRERWGLLDLSEDKTIEARLREGGLR